MSTNHSEAIDLEGLDELYCRLVVPNRSDARSTWRLFAASPYYRRELRRSAARIVRARRLPPDRLGDIVHDALLLLADCLRRKGQLSFKPEFGRQRFAAWLGAIARAHCRWAVRRQKSRGRRCEELCPDWATAVGPTVEWHAEFAEALASLDEGQRAVIAAYRQFGSIEAAAAHLGVSTTTAWRQFRAAVSAIRRRCGPFVASHHVIGLSAVIEKW